MKGEITILQKAVAASLQDQGRINFADHGVPRAGTLDRKSARKVNSILGNKKDATVLEWALQGPILRFSHASYICLSQVNSSTRLNGNAIRAHEKIYVPANSNLQLGSNSQVLYQYLAIKGGFVSKRMLESQSTLTGYKDLYQNRLKYEAITQKTFELPRPVFDIPSIKSNTLVCVIPVHQGPEYHLLSKAVNQKLEKYFSLTQNRDRMGIHIEQKVSNSIGSLLSVPTIPGTIQLTPGGTMIILGKDCQTTGGYPRILWLPEDSLAKLYQLQSGIKFRFDIID